MTIPRRFGPYNEPDLRRIVSSALAAGDAGVNLRASTLTAIFAALDKAEKPAAPEQLAGDAWLRQSPNFHPGDIA